MRRLVCVLGLQAQQVTKGPSKYTTVRPRCKRMGHRITAEVLHLALFFEKIGRPKNTLMPSRHCKKEREPRPFVLGHLFSPAPPPTLQNTPFHRLRIVGSAVPARMPSSQGYVVSAMDQHPERLFGVFVADPSVASPRTWTGVPTDAPEWSE